MTEQDHDGDVDVDDGDVDLAPPHESLHQKTLVFRFRSMVHCCVMRSEGPLSHQPDGPIQTFSGDCFRLSVRFNIDKSALETCVRLRRSGNRGLGDQYSYQE